MSGLFKSELFFCEIYVYMMIDLLEDVGSIILFFLQLDFLTLYYNENELIVGGD